MNPMPFQFIYGRSVIIYVEEAGDRTHFSFWQYPAPADVDDNINIARAIQSLPSTLLDHISMIRIS